MSLVELIAQADERGLATSGLGCLDRCVPLLGVGGPGDPEEDVLRPLWASLAEDGADWGARLVAARDELSGAAGKGEAAELVRRMLGAAPERAVAVAWREWADACSVAALQVHRMLDVTEDRAAGVSARREGRTEGMSPLVAAELRRQTQILELLAGGGAGGLRQALVVSTEGRRVLRAAVSRRARGRG
ncbi:hypothetical protein OG785_14240 [Streptomyces sp. NBC_00006]|uniref:hypothetical protein n=1 Tax=unclassified Streptomyces TaxID=2593676 RepID=UPI002250775E|nr:MULTISPECIES: hypothetical protein [unclassified Streptomyces]MCX5531722.1 hypothetical protein [Streptomyces sp. NBC_00006]